MGFHSVAAFNISGNRFSAFFLISIGDIIPIGCDTITKQASAAPWLRAVSFANPMNSVVAMVIVGMPNFSRLSWSTTSHEVQEPQSACEPMTRSGLKAAIFFANSLLLSGL
jgi:hypothetical protein